MLLPKKARARSQGILKCTEAVSQLCHDIHRHWTSFWNLRSVQDSLRLEIHHFAARKVGEIAERAAPEAKQLLLLTCANHYDRAAAIALHIGGSPAQQLSNRIHAHRYYARRCEVDLVLHQLTGKATYLDRILSATDFITKHIAPADHAVLERHIRELERLRGVLVSLPDAARWNRRIRRIDTRPAEYTGA